MTVKRIISSISILLIAGCASIGNNQQFSLSSKRDLRDFYAVEDPTNEYAKSIPPYKKYYNKDHAKDVTVIVEPSRNASRSQKIKYDKYVKYKSELEKYYLNERKREHRVIERSLSLVPNYISTDPYTLTDPYDVRLKAGKMIQKGEPLAIIINKVRLGDNSESFYELFDNAEIAVVVSIDTGDKVEGKKDVIVAYERYIADNVDLPISDLLVYYDKKYKNQPIKITITIFEFDQGENKFMEGILSQAVNAIAGSNPAFAAVGSIASEIGTFLLNQNKDDIIAKLTFQLYPDQKNLKISTDRKKCAINKCTDLDKGDSFGVPVVAFGQKIIINSEDSPWELDRRKIHIDYDLNAWVYDVSDKEINNIQDKIHNTSKLPHFPDTSVIKKYPREPLENTYVVFTIDNTEMPEEFAKNTIGNSKNKK